MRPLCEKRDKLFGSIQLQLRAHGVSHLAYEELESVEQKYVKQYFKSSVLPILSPQIVDTHHPFPHLQNKVIHVCAMLKFKSKQVFAVIPVPQALPEVLFLPGIDVRYIRMEDIILEFIRQVFDNYTVDEKVCICITNCQGLFNQIHRKLTKGARSTVWLLTPHLTDYIFPFSRSLQRYA